MQGTHSRTSFLAPVIDIEMRSRAFSLVSVINMEVAKTNTCFLTFEALDTYLQSVSSCYS